MRIKTMCMLIKFHQTNKEHKTNIEKEREKKRIRSRKIDANDTNWAVSQTKNKTNFVFGIIKNRKTLSEERDEEKNEFAICSWNMISLNDVLAYILLCDDIYPRAYTKLFTFMSRAEFFSSLFYFFILAWRFFFSSSLLSFSSFEVACVCCRCRHFFFALFFVQFERKTGEAEKTTTK